MAVVSLTVFVVTSVGQLGQTTFDDAYMFTRYAKHWLAGDGFSWNLGEGPAYGLTSAAYLFVVTAVLAVTHASDGWVLTAISFSAALLSIVAMVWLAWLASGPGDVRRAWIPLLVVPMVVLIPGLRYHGLTGMETTLALLVNSVFAGSAVHLARRQDSRTMVVCLAFAYAAYLTRPDAGLCGLLLPPTLLLASGADRRAAARYVAGFLSIVVADLGLKWWLFGDVLPLPFFVKQQGFYRGYLNGMTWNAMGAMLQFWDSVLPVALVTVAFVRRETWRQVAAVALPVLLTFIYLGSVLQIMGFRARYYYPYLPFFVLAAFMSLQTSGRHTAAQQGNWIGLRLVSGMLLLLVSLSVPLKASLVEGWVEVMHAGETTFEPTTKYSDPIGEPLRRMPSWDAALAMTELVASLPRGIVFATSEHGYLGSQLPDLRIVDISGLHDRGMAHQGFSAAAVLARRPDLIWMPLPEYSFAVSELLDAPVFRSDYEYYMGPYSYGDPPPGGYAHGIAIRRDSTFAAEIVARVTDDVARRYGGARLADYLVTPLAVP